MCIRDRIGSEYQYLARRMGFDAGAFLPTLTVAPAADAAVLGTLVEHGLVPGAYAVFAPFTTRPQKHWFEDAWQALAPLLIEATGLFIAGVWAATRAAGDGCPRTCLLYTSWVPRSRT